MAPKLNVPVGIVFPQAETAGNVVFAREFSIAVEDLGYDQLVLYEHVLGADPAHHTLSGPYTHRSPFWEPFVFFSHVAALTSTIEFVLAVLVLPQRQTALVAKQAATLDLLCNDRFRLGVGVGWNQVEYEALGENFRTRGKRIEEQIPLLRRLWRENLVTHEGKFDAIHHASILPRPNRDIPIWFGGWSDRVLDRLGRLGDGWLAATGSPKTALGRNRILRPEDLQHRIERIKQSAEQSGRDPNEIGISMLVSAVGYEGTVMPFDPGEWVERATQWVEAGATEIIFASVDLDFSPNDHLSVARDLASALDL